jgi:MazG family protein
MRDEAVESLRALNEVVERLRAPNGCPWDREQTHSSLRPYLLEEAYELLEAIDGGGSATLREELGDVLLQVLMHCAIASEGDTGFDLGDVAEVTRAKMVYRHPHVFADTAVDGAAEVVVNWERLKRSEKSERLSVLDGVPRTLPALAFAHGVQKRPARIGFDEIPTAADALAAMAEALHRTAETVVPGPGDELRGRDWPSTERAGDGGGPGSSASAREEAIGELLFAAVALARLLRVNPEDALRRRTNVFAERFRSLEQRARQDGVDLHDLDEVEWRRRWETAAPG